MANPSADERPVVVGVDQSDSARDAALWAAELAAVMGVPLRVCHVVDRAGTVSEPPMPAWLDALADQARRLGAHPVDARVLFGTATDQLLMQAREARLLVLGSYGEQGWSGTLIGRIGQRLVDQSSCPVVVARGFSPGLAPPRGGPVVVGVDGTAASVGALRFAANLASRTQHGQLVAVHTWSDIATDAEGHAYRRTEDPTKLAAAAEELLERSLAPVLAEHPGLTVQRDVRQDTPLRALIEHARDAWLIVVGQRSETTQPGMRAGSTSRGLVEFAPCPVAVVAHPPPATSESTGQP
jgi:nucleotide-binding universal stress UspA family protein